MNPMKFQPKKGPEYEIQQEIIKQLRYREWFVKPTHGNMFQSGFPDLFCAHYKYGIRWVEVKNPKGYAFTPAQMEDFPKFSAAGVGIWILTGADETELNKLFGPANWHTYLSIWK